jgi:hypothetical protein
MDCSGGASHSCCTLESRNGIESRVIAVPRIHNTLRNGLIVRNLIAATFISTLLVTPVFAQTEFPAAADSTVASSSEATLDQVLVTGEQAGPGLWKISKGDHVLWIFGSYTPLPKKMTWRSKNVEATISQSQELLTGVDIDMDVGFFGGLAMLPSLIGMRNTPGGALKDVVPPDLYARWLVQKEKYIGHDNSVEKWRPIFAAGELYSKSIEQAGFEGEVFPTSGEIHKQVERLARKHKIKITTPTIEVKVPKARAWVKEVKRSSLDDLACLTKTLERLETDMDQLRVRANAWAIGDVKALRARAEVEQQDACATAFFAMLNLPGAQERGFDQIPTRIVDTWVTAAEAALERNESTFAVLSIEDIFWNDGYVAKLRAKGYTVVDP